MDNDKTKTCVGFQHTFVHYINYGELQQILKINQEYSININGYVDTIYRFVSIKTEKEEKYI